MGVLKRDFDQDLFLLPRRWLDEGPGQGRGSPSGSRANRVRVTDWTRGNLFVDRRDEGF